LCDEARESSASKGRAADVLFVWNLWASTRSKIRRNDVFGWIEHALQEGKAIKNEPLAKFHLIDPARKQ
jgi:hypothetical protein